MSKNLQEGLAEYAHIRFLGPAESRFSVTSGGFLSLKCGEDESYALVRVFRSFPLSMVDRYLSVRDEKDKEIGIIADLADFPPHQMALIQDELERRYFTPMIERVIRMKEEFGYIYWDVDTDRGRRRFTTRSSHESILPVSDYRLFITDVDGNRFEIADFRALDPQSVRKVEALI